MNLIEFMQSPLYMEYLDELDKYIPEKIDRTPKFHAVIINLLNKELSFSSLSIDDLKWLISHERISSIRYIAKKQAVYTKPNGGKDNIVNETPGLYFPIVHLIEYYLLYKKPHDLLNYVKKIRIPSTKKYIKEITEIFSEIKSLKN